jgi:predicted polyphosphate/ATP-dependent NAD kinase
MRLRELISVLQDIANVHGDLPVFIYPAGTDLFYEVTATYPTADTDEENGLCCLIQG